MQASPVHKPIGDASPLGSGRKFPESRQHPNVTWAQTSYPEAWQGDPRRSGDVVSRSSERRVVTLASPPPSTPTVPVPHAAAPCSWRGRPGVRRDAARTRGRRAGFSLFSSFSFFCSFLFTCCCISFLFVFYIFFFFHFFRFFLIFFLAFFRFFTLFFIIFLLFFFMFSFFFILSCFPNT